MFAQLERNGHSWSWLIQRMSFQLESYLIKKLYTLPAKDHVQIVSLGSWSRSELCPRSDIDVILVGEDKDILKFVEQARGLQIELKYRTPENMNDWKEGVDNFDLLALYKARAVDESIRALVEEQKQKLSQFIVKENKSLAWAELMRSERERRNKRYDSLANYLEPNLKYGPGALRDAGQTTVTVELFQEQFKAYQDEISYFNNCKSFLLVVRHLLHLIGGTDILDANATKKISQLMGFASPREFNAQVQKSLHEINFFTLLAEDIVIGKVEKNVDTISGEDYLTAIFKPSTVVQQNYIRKHIKKVQLTEADKKSFCQQFEQVQDEQIMYNLYQSEVLFKFFINLKRCQGHVQHDHYHRYTVDAHTVQALRFYCKAKQQPKEVLGKNSEWLLSLSKQEERILLWSLLYHDMAKGLPGSHSELGAELVANELGSFVQDDGFVNEVAWQVKNHLILSEAAFRKNPEDPLTWRGINEKGANKSRVKVLACLTAIDIIATNVEAWTPWKSDLLYRLVQRLLADETINFLDLYKTIAGLASAEMTNEFLNRLDMMLLGQFEMDLLKNDFNHLTTSNKDLPLLFAKGVDDYTWVRFHSYENKKGFFLECCQVLYSLSCTVREAYIHTYNSFGAYNWFKVKTQKEISTLKKQIDLIEIEPVVVEGINFDSIKVIDHPYPDEWIVRFKGLDQKGALLAAVNMIFACHLEVLWARVHTWGDVLEDVFAVCGKESDVLKLTQQD